MAKEEPLDDPDLDVVELLNLRLDKVVRDLRDATLERLSVDATPEEIDRGVSLAIRNLAAKQSSEDRIGILDEDESRLFDTINAVPSDDKRARWV